MKGIVLHMTMAVINHIKKTHKPYKLAKASFIDLAKGLTSLMLVSHIVKGISPSKRASRTYSYKTGD